MKIRHKITLWITGAGIVTSLLFSLVVFVELIEYPYELIDAELQSTAATLASSLQKRKTPTSAASALIPEIFNEHYWIKVFDSNGQIVYESKLAKLVELPLRKKNTSYTFSVRIPKGVVNLQQDRRNEVTFRARISDVRVGGEKYQVQIAKPIEGLEEEVGGLVYALSLGFAASTLLLVAVGYMVAGRILKPIGAINSLAAEISERTLDKRIPLGKSYDELYVLAGSLNRMFDRLQDSFDRQKQFVADASHELKTPLATLRLFFEEAVHRNDLPESFSSALAGQSEVLLRMNRLVKGLLDLSALELKQTIELEEIDLASLFEEILRELTPFIQARGIRIENRLPKIIRFHADRLQMRRLLINLLDNAVKYNWDSGELRLEGVEGEDTVSFSIFNTGPGVPKEDLNKVFEQFYRVEKSRSHRYGGSGLGLSIVRRIVKLHAGTVAMESEPGAWARVQIILPKHPNSSPPPF